MTNRLPDDLREQLYKLQRDAAEAFEETRPPGDSTSEALNRYFLAQARPGDQVNFHYVDPNSETGFDCLQLRVEVGASSSIYLLDELTFADEQGEAVMVGGNVWGQTALLEDMGDKMHLLDGEGDLNDLAGILFDMTPTVYKEGYLLLYYPEFIPGQPAANQILLPPGYFIDVVKNVGRSETDL